MSPYNYEPPNHPGLTPYGNPTTDYSGPSFDTGVRNAFQNMGHVDVTPRAIPWSGIDVPVVTRLPSNPNDQAEVNYVADATNGVVWRLVYLLSDNKWHYIGGPPLIAEVATEQATSSATYTDLATVGPSVTLPLAGNYDVGIGARTYTSTADTSGIVSYSIGATAASNTDRFAIYGAGISGGFSHAAHSMRMMRKTGLGAVALTMKYASINSVSWTFGYRWISATPVSVSA